MRDYKKEFENRVAFIKNLLEQSGAKGIVFGNSGGKDSALVGILCKAACDDTVGVILPCALKRNYELDADDGRAVAEQFGIETRVVDLTPVREAELKALEGVTEMTPGALANIAPRLRMTTLYAIAGAENRLVAGTGNKSEIYVGYFTKWGDGAHDFNPIADLTATEVFEFLRYLDAPKSVIEKAPSAALFEGQTDETEMGVTYAELDSYINGGTIPEDKKAKIDRLHRISEHKRTGIARYEECQLLTTFPRRDFMKKKTLLFLCLTAAALCVAGLLTSLYLRYFPTYRLGENGKVFQKYDGKGSQFVVPDGVETIDAYAFKDCESLKTVVLPKTLKTIETRAFSCCTALESIDIPEGVKEIEACAFENCFSLKTLSIPQSVEKIGLSAFDGCLYMTSINVAEKNERYRSIDGVLFSKDGKTLVRYPAYLANERYVVPEGVETIDYHAFQYCSALKSVVLPESLNEVGLCAFDYCTSLSEVALPNGVRRIGHCAFHRCINLTSIVLPDGVEEIGGSAFSECNLTQIVLPDSVVGVGENAFDHCTCLESIVVPNGVTEIKKSTFWGDDALQTVVLPESVERIEDNAFAYCNSLTIRAPKGSYAEQYALENDIPFEPIE